MAVRTYNYIYYPLPLTLVRGYRIEMNWALAPMFFLDK
jgi:hypothetical protein